MWNSTHFDEKRQKLFEVCVLASAPLIESTYALRDLWQPLDAIPELSSRVKDIHIHFLI